MVNLTLFCLAVAISSSASRIPARSTVQQHVLAGPEDDDRGRSNGRGLRQGGRGWNRLDGAIAMPDDVLVVQRGGGGADQRPHLGEPLRPDLADVQSVEPAPSAPAVSAEIYAAPSVLDHDDGNLVTLAHSPGHAAWCCPYSTTPCERGTKPFVLHPGRRGSNGRHRGRHPSARLQLQVKTMMPGPDRGGDPAVPDRRHRGTWKARGHRLRRRTGSPPRPLRGSSGHRLSSSTRGAAGRRWRPRWLRATLSRRQPAVFLLPGSPTAGRRRNATISVFAAVTEVRAEEIAGIRRAGSLGI